MKRVLNTIIGIPIILSVIFFLHHLHYLAFFIVSLIFTLLGTHETKVLVERSLNITINFPFWLTLLIPISVHLEQFYFPEIPLLKIAAILILIGISFLEIFTGAHDNFSNSILRLQSSIFITVYPAGFVVFVMLLTTLPFAGWHLVLLFLLIFTNDVFAYVFGMWLGKNSRNIVKASPNKSLAGFIGGTILTVVVGFILTSLAPDFLNKAALLNKALLFLTISVAANTGDLLESVLKRSAGEKDSGSLMPGRGGILDSIDSIIFSAPLYYLYLILFILV